MEIIKAVRFMRNVLDQYDTWHAEQPPVVWNLTPHNAVSYSEKGDIMTQMPISEDVYTFTRLNGSYCDMPEPNGIQYLWVLFAERKA